MDQTILQADPNRSFDPPVLIAKATESGHSGKVIFTTSTNNQGRLLWIRGLSGLKFTGFTFQDLREPTSVLSGFVETGDRDNPSFQDTGRIHFDACHFISNGAAGLIGFASPESIVSNSILESIANDDSADSDPIASPNAGGGYLIIENNRKRSTNRVVTDARESSTRGGDGEREPRGLVEAGHAMA
ncbi:MAG: hypothetical protein IT307_09800 [Chloroflexi bacterium]|nr:hypothetical protein [Chloroflexota bacterium]